MNEASMQFMTLVNTYYENAWAKLLIVITIIFTFIGIIFPILYQWFQKKSFNVITIKTKEELIENIENMKKSLSTELTNELDGKIKKEIESLEQKYIDMKHDNERAMAGIFHVQGNFYFDKNMITSAIESFVTSAEKYFFAEDHVNLERVLDIIERTLKSITKDDIESNQQIFTSLEQLITSIGKNDQKNIYQNYTEKINREFTKAKKRIKEAGK